MVKKLAKKVKADQEQAAKRQVLEELFMDFHSSRAQVYKVNFFRGIFFGLGSVLGGTIVVALIVWLLATVGQTIPPLQDALDGVSKAIEPNQ